MKVNASGKISLHMRKIYLATLKMTEVWFSSMNCINNKNGTENAYQIIFALSSWFQISKRPQPLKEINFWT